MTDGAEDFTPIELVFLREAAVEAAKNNLRRAILIEQFGLDEVACSQGWAL